MGPGDDCAVVDGTAITVDTMVEGVHWNDRLAPGDVGFKAIAVSVSDLAAIGARPVWALLALSLPAPADAAWVAAFATGVGEACRAFSVDLVGGDITRSPGPRFVSATLGGPCPRPVLRSGGRAGDLLWVTGVPGLAGGGYLLDDPPAPALEALRRPRPPLAFALDLADQGLATAMMDLSDGLADDLRRLCVASGTAARLDPTRLPPLPLDVDDPVPLQVASGEDYQLLFATAPHSAARVRALAASHGVLLSLVGSLEAGRGARLVGRDWPTAAFTHFGSARWPT